VLRRIWSVIQKEFIQVLRDRRTLLIQVSIPMIELFLFGYAINMSPDHIPMVVADQSLDGASRAYVDAMVTSSYFDLVGYLPGQADVVKAIDEGRAQAGIVIPDSFAAAVERDRAQVLLLVDGSDLFTSQSAYNAATLIAGVHSTNLLLARVERSGRAAGQQALLPLDTRVRTLYNPDLNSLWFIIPGIIAVLLQVQGVALIASAVVRERERGNIEQILVTPIRSGELMLGKMVPAAFIAMINVLTILAIGMLWFKVPFQGNFWLFLWLSFLYVVSVLGLGLLVSTVSQTQKQAFQIIGAATLVAVVLSGFMFPRYTMPPLIRAAGNLFPVTYFVPIARGIITKGLGLSFFRGQVLALLVYGVVIIVVSARAFRTRLE